MTFLKITLRSVFQVTVAGPIVIASLFGILSVHGMAHADDLEGTFKVSNQNFKTLFNKYRVATPKNIPWPGSYWPYANEGIAWTDKKVGLDQSPAAKYDLEFNTKGKAEKWELENHTCDTINVRPGNKGDKESKQGCIDWWGHCNAWSGAAIKEEEPVTSSGRFDVADKKAFLTEIWMNSGSLFAGDTMKEEKTGQWVQCDPDPKATPNPECSRADYKISGQMVDRDTTAYDAFWDVTPRTFFYIFTNYVGILQTGVVIDRFTGDQVWNQPIVGYHFLPIRNTDLASAVTMNDPESGKPVTVYPVTIRVKMYWADDGVQPNHVGGGFKIQDTTEDEAVEHQYLDSDDPNVENEYVGRFLKFKLFFNLPVKVSTDGTKVVSAGQIVGDGIWDHQENPKNYKDLDATHPDFIWLPTELESGGGTANPYLKASNVYQLMGKTGTVGKTDGSEGDQSNADVQKKTFTLTFANKTFAGVTDLANPEESIKRKVKKILTNNGVTSFLSLKGIKLKARSIEVSGEISGKITQNKLLAIFQNSDYPATSALILK